MKLSYDSYHHECQLKNAHYWAFPMDFHNGRSSAYRSQRLPATLMRSSVHLVGGHPTLHLPTRNRHYRTFLPHLSSVLRAMYPAHCYFNLLILRTHSRFCLGETLPALFSPSDTE